AAGARDRLVFFGNAGGDLRLNDFFVVLARAQGASVHNLDAGGGGDVSIVENQFLDVTLGMAFRPRHSDRFEALLKGTRRYSREPVNFERTQYQLRIIDVVAFEPALEIGWGFQFVGKLALKNAE